MPASPPPITRSVPGGRSGSFAGAAPGQPAALARAKPGTAAAGTARPGAGEGGACLAPCTIHEPASPVVVRASPDTSKVRGCCVQLAKHWRHLAKKEAKAAQQDGYVPVAQRLEAAFLPSLLSEFLGVLAGIAPDAMEEDGLVVDSGNVDRQALLYCERFVEFLTDLMSQVGCCGPF